jgi:uncharacterized membrane protein (TIGR02234 family)
VTPRRELWLALALCLLGSAVALLGVRHAWSSYETSGGLTIDEVSKPIRGTAVAGVVQALAVVGLAGVVAVAATKRRGRVLVGVLLAAAGALVVADVVSLAVDGLGHRLAREGCRGLCVVSQEQYDAGPDWAWPVLTAVGGLLLLAGGLLVVVRGRRWAALGASYEAPSARAEAEPVTDKAVWDALDEGHDPTA